MNFYDSKLAEKRQVARPMWLVKTFTSCSMCSKIMLKEELCEAAQTQSGTPMLSSCEYCKWTSFWSGDRNNTHINKTSNRKCVALNLQGCLCLVPHKTGATTQDTLYILGSLTNSTRTKKITRGISREKACILKHQVAQNERCSFQLEHRLPILLTAFLGQAVHSRHSRRISSLHRTDTPGE